MKRVLLSALFGLACAVFAGCGDDYSHTQVTSVVGSFTGPTTSSKDTIDPSHIQITEGNILKAHIVVFNDDDEQMPLTIKVTTPGKMEVAAATTPDDYTFIGIEVGQAEIQLIADGNRILSIKADVVAQPAP